MKMLVFSDQGWTKPMGTGKISLPENRTVLHASYNKER